MLDVRCHFGQTMCFPPVFHHLPVEPGFIRTERADNAGLSVSGQDMVPQVPAMGGAFKSTVWAHSSHALVLYLLVTFQVSFGFSFVITEITLYLYITVDGDHVSLQKIFPSSSVITMVTFEDFFFVNCFNVLFYQIFTCCCVLTVLVFTADSDIDILVNSPHMTFKTERSGKVCATLITGETLPQVQMYHLNTPTTGW